MHDGVPRSLGGQVALGSTDLHTWMSNLYLPSPEELLAGERSLLILSVHLRIRLLRLRQLNGRPAF